MPGFDNAFNSGHLNLAGHTECVPEIEFDVIHFFFHSHKSRPYLFCSVLFATIRQKRPQVAFASQKSPTGWCKTTDFQC